MAKLIIRDRRDKGWFYMDNDYLNGYAKIFGAIGTAIYVSLCRHANSKTQQCFPSYKKIGEELSLSEKTVKKYIGKFKEYNLISVFQEKKSDGTYRANTYTLLDKSVWKSKPKVTKVPTELGGTKFQHGGELNSKTVGNEIPNKETNTNKTNVNKIVSTDKEKINTGEFINLFKEVNPSYKQLFNRTTEHKAMNRMIAEHSAEQMRKVIKSLVKSNAMPYAPSITSPYELEMKFGKLKAFWQKEANKINENNSIIL